MNLPEIGKEKFHDSSFEKIELIGKKAILTGTYCDCFDDIDKKQHPDLKIIINNIDNIELNIAHIMNTRPNEIITQNYYDIQEIEKGETYIKIDLHICGCDVGYIKFSGENLSNNIQLKTNGSD